MSPTKYNSPGKGKKSTTGKFKGSPSKGPLKPKLSSRIYTVGLKEGVMVAFVKNAMNEDQAYFHPVKAFLLNNDEDMTQLKLKMIVPRCNPDGSNTRMPSSLNSAYSFDLFVGVMQDIDQNTPLLCSEWGKALSKFFNSKRSLFTYEVNFEHSGDLSGPNKNDLAPVSSYLMNCSIIELIKDIYSTVSMEELANDAETVANLFGAEGSKDGKELMLVEGTVRSFREHKQMASVLLLESCFL